MNLLTEKETDSQILKMNLQFTKGACGRACGWAGVWDENAIKLSCDDGCTTINIIKFTELKKEINLYLRS